MSRPGNGSDGIASLGPLFDQLAGQLGDLSPVMADIGELLVASTKRRFGEGVSPDGVAWAPKSITTVEVYRRREGRKKNGSVDPRPLFGPSGRLSSEIFSVPGTSSVEVGSALIYAGTMHFGASKGEFGTYQGKGFGGSTPTISIPWGNIPARPFIGVSTEDWGNIDATLREWLDTLTDSAC